MTGIYLYSDRGRQRLREVIRPGMLCAFDFDGTLAPIAHDPAAVTMSPGLRGLFTQLSARTPVAVITGRAAADCAPRRGFDPTYLLGNHGIEGLPTDAGSYSTHLLQVAGWRAALQTLLGRAAPALHGAWLEDKEHSLSLHYRACSLREAARELLLEMAAVVAPEARVIEGKCVVSLLPPGAGDKGAALAWLRRHHGDPTTLYVGDDANDEDAFRLAAPDVLTIRVGRDDTSAAECYIVDPDELVALVRELLDVLPTAAVSTVPKPRVRPAGS